MKKGRSLENGNMNQIYAAKTNHITNPVGFLLNPVVFSWKVRECRGKNQRCARILVAKDETFADVLWDTGEAKLDSLAVKAEMNLEPCTRYYWKVIVTTDADEVLESDVQFLRRQRGTSRGWENGLPATAGWNAIPFSQSESFPVER